jgi:hypothetical protein
MRGSALLLATGAAAAAGHAPSFFWSPQSLDGLARNAQHVGEASGAIVERVVSALVDRAAPEVSVVFVAEGLETEGVREHGAALRTLEKLLKSSKSSLTVPFTEAQQGVRLFERATRVAGAEAEAYFKAHASLFSNGAPDVVVVELAHAAGASVPDRLASYDALVGRVTAVVDSASRGNYAALLTGAHGGAARRLSIVSQAGYIHNTPALLTAQVIMLMLILIFLGGFCCLFNLQTPKRFDEVKQA